MEHTMYGDPDHELELIEWERRMEMDYELFAKSDYIREAYGDPCKVHGTLRYGGDCGACEAAMYEEETTYCPLPPTHPAYTPLPVPVPLMFDPTDDDIPF
jgi:hypothetical protein